MSASKYARVKHLLGSKRSKLLLLIIVIVVVLASGSLTLLHMRQVEQDGPWTYQYVVRPSDNGDQLIIGQSIRLELVVGKQWVYRADGPLRRVANNTFAGNPQDAPEKITAWQRGVCRTDCMIKFTVQVYPNDLMNICNGPAGTPCNVPDTPTRGLVQITEPNGFILTPN